ncbi:MAG: hypothetical protein KKE30_04945 [Gammaproteobacteria bacterium]|nr:hypothetical protein [Gammaproteobacteria bacterium]MBU1556046.1 hypothetical protein [Gammaproteobacteria bacterium]MBU2069217.1 hypothetical protein [Gammaproteobacteria bacterium]MBU2182312.1 hypothetical protein [Gammaproteobacteria bacterium]MBU2204916.1 hypothetical protein [Gammaproteobacteria bacterium]
MKNLTLKLLLYYFIVAGIAAHLLLLVVLVKDRTLIPVVQEKLVNFVVGHRADAPALLPSTEQIHADIAAVFTPWQADNKSYPARYGVWVNNQPFDSLPLAVAALNHGDTLHIGSGVYDNAFKISKNDITIIGYGHVVFEKGSVNGKGFILATGNNLTVHNIECRYISVPSKNGACIRLEGLGLTLNKVYFHSSEEGILETASKPGNVYITNSRFELLGKAGQAHAMYLNKANLFFSNSIVVASKDQGHGIKSRGAVTVIENSILASLSAQDSRLVDISNGGKLSIKGSVLQQGPFSANHQAIGYGLEGIKHSENAVSISDNVFILERQGSNLLYKAHDAAPPAQIINNMIVGADSSDNDNFHFANRQKAGLAAYPLLPALLCDSGQKC